jgi:hypothetical protein
MNLESAATLTPANMVQRETRLGRVFTFEEAYIGRRRWSRWVVIICDYVLQKIYSE